MTRDIPAQYMDGIVAIDVSPRRVPHPVREGVYTLGECVPVHADGPDVMSRVVLYHGSFAELASEDPGFRWEDETWETLLHELRHHLEWRANAAALEAYDWATEQNFARQDGRAFDPMFYQAGERLDDGLFRVDDDVFVERVVRSRPAELQVTWRGRRYRADLPPGGSLPLYVALDRIAEPPQGDLIVVVRRRPRLWDLVRRARTPEHHRASVRAI